MLACAPLCGHGETASSATKPIIKVGLLHGDPEPFSLPLAVLRQAFAHMQPPREMKLVDISHMNQHRALTAMSRRQVPFDIFFSGFSKAREEQLLQIDVPLTQGLLGARVLVINNNRQDALLQQLQSATDVRNLAIGSGIQWPDTEILQKNGFQIVEGKYQNLWKMLQNQRIDAFARGIEEAFTEIEQRKANRPQPDILQGWLLVYPLDYFVYLPKSRAELYTQLNQALLKALNSGDIRRTIEQHPSAQQALQWLRSQQYQTLYLHNPLLSERLKTLPAEYWLPEVRKATSQMAKDDL